TASASASATARAGTGKVPGGNWATLRGDGDLPAFVARLRAAGYPASIIRALVGAAVNEQFAARRKALSPTPEENAFWSGRSPLGANSDPARLAARRELAREQTKLMKELLGPDAQGDQIEMSVFQKQQYGNLPREKIEQLQLVVQDYQELIQQVRAESQGVLLREDREKLAYLEAEKRKDIARMLSPEEFEEYQMRSSNTASQLRYQLAAFEPSEQEFRALFKLQERYDEQFGPNAVGARGTQESAQLRNAATKQLMDDAKAVLGAERGAEYERSRDYAYQSAASIAKRLNLPKEAATAVWELQKDVQQRTADLQRDRTLTPEQRTERLTALSAEANSKVTAALSERGATAYKDSGGYWLRNIVPQVQPGRGGTTTIVGPSDGKVMVR
ncbi:MAG: hypothetical protein ABIZ49_04740, partial [Opitutaceae bacterium]